MTEKGYEFFAWAPEGTEYTVRSYGMDEESLREATDIIRSRNRTVPESLEISDGLVRLKADAKKGDILFTSIPAAEGWSAKINGEDAEILKFMDSLIMLELKEGENDIELKYSLPGLKGGIAISLCTALFIMLVWVRYVKDGALNEKKTE